MHFVGVDVGSVAAKAVVFGDGRIVGSAVLPTGWSPREAGRRVFADALTAAGVEPAEVARVVGTGYGRVALDFADQVVTEITCHAAGAEWLFPGNDTVIDVGGQDTKVIKVGPDGKVLNFVMNDKCAAGTGRFLQVMATTLGLELDELAGLEAVDPVAINSMCTVFAESEVVSLLASGTAKERIVAGLCRATAQRVAAMSAGLGGAGGVTFTGGVANVSQVRRHLKDALGCPVMTPPHPELTGALGAALLAVRACSGSGENG